MMRLFHFRVSVCVLFLTFMFVVGVSASSCDYYTQRVQCGDLACSKETKECIPCSTNDDCYPGAMECNRATGKCKVHSVFKHFNVLTAFAFIFAFIVCAVGVIAGVGGGGILVPMFTPMLQFPMVSAVALSQSTICGQATLNVFLSMRQKHPDLTWDRPLINYQYLSILLPLGLIGTLIGGILNNICPDFIRLLLLFILLTAVLIRTINRTRKQFSKDKKHEQSTSPFDDENIVNDDNNNATNNDNVSSNHNKAEDITVINFDVNIQEKNNNHNDIIVNCKNNNNDVVINAVEAKARNENAVDSSDVTNKSFTLKKEKLQYESCHFEEMSVSSPTEIHHRPPLPQYPKFEIIMYLVSFCVLLIFNIVRAKVKCGGWTYWICVVIPLVTLGSVFGYCYYRLKKIHENYPTRLTFKWNFKNSVIYPSVAIVAGAAASMLGIGGGLVLGFVMYEVGLPPEETSMTSGSATFFLAFSSALELLVAGHLQIDYGLLGFIMGIASTALGQLVIMRQIRRRGWLFLIVGSLALIVGGSLMILGGYGIYDAVNTTQKGGSIFSLGRLCQL